MIFDKGFVHCDPHPGNILVKNVKNSAQIILLDHGLYTTLSEDFRHTYANFWLSILNADPPSIQKWSEKLNVGQLYVLFSCIITGRTWSSLTVGIDKTDLTSDEQLAIKQNAAKFLPQIGEILRRIPREMLLILKTNDLLRNIEFSIKTQNSMHSFVMLSRYCIRAVYSERLRHCRSLLCKLQNHVGLVLAQFKISIYQFVLWFRKTFFARMGFTALRKNGPVQNLLLQRL